MEIFAQVRIRLLQPPPIKVSLDDEVFRIDFVRLNSEFKGGGYIAAFLGDAGVGHYLLTHAIAGAEQLTAAWEAGFEHVPAISTTIDGIVDALIEQGLAERVAQKGGE